MADIAHLLLCDFVYIGKYSGKIIVSHMLKGEFPKLFAFIRIIFGVIPRVLVASTVP